MSARKQRGKGTGTIYKPRNSRFMWIAYMSGGKRHHESSKSERIGDAQRLLTSRLGDIGKGIEVTPKVGRKTVGEGLKAVVENQKMNGRRSFAHTQRRIDKHLLKYFNPDRRLSSITTGDLTSYVLHRQGQKASAASCNLELAILKRAYTLALRAKELLHAPYIPMLTLHNVRTGFLERDQFDAIHAALPDPLKGLVTLAYYTGLRVQSEVLPLQWSQVDRQSKRIRLEPGTTKNDEGRTLPYGLLPEVVKVIDAAWKAHEELLAADRLCPFVFHRKGKRIKTLYGAWNAACETAGCPGKLLHDCRRTAVRNFVRNGVSEKTAMTITGHKTRSVFDRYDIVNEADLEQALGKVSTGEAPAPPVNGKVKRFKKA